MIEGQEFCSFDGRPHDFADEIIRRGSQKHGYSERYTGRDVCLKCGLARVADPVTWAKMQHEESDVRAFLI